MPSNSSLQPEVVVLDGKEFMCVACRMRATREIDGTSTCLYHYQSVMDWARQKRRGKH